MSDRFGMTGNYLIHSAKGTSWEKKDHKWVKKKFKVLEEKLDISMIIT